MRFGVLGTADVAFRRFLPALLKCDDHTYVGVATRTPEKGVAFSETFGGQIYNSYDSLLADEKIDAVYVPLPPALHFVWGKKVLESGKHLLMEKPFTVNSAEAEELLQLAEEKKLAVYENYMFLCHCQLERIRAFLKNNAVGELRLLQISFGFPKRSVGDFRYKKVLGGGALLDCGGYTIRLALEFLGESARVAQAQIIAPPSYEVDLFGSAVLENDTGLCAQLSFGMDNAYQCRLEIWGSKATLVASRIFTAGVGVIPQIKLQYSNGEEIISVPADDHFFRSIERFEEICRSMKLQRQTREQIRMQAKMMDEVFQIGRRDA